MPKTELGSTAVSTNVIDPCARASRLFPSDLFTLEEMQLASPQCAVTSDAVTQPKDLLPHRDSFELVKLRHFVTMAVCHKKAWFSCVESRVTKSALFRQSGWTSN